MTAESTLAAPEAFGAAEPAVAAGPAVASAAAQVAPAAPRRAARAARHVVHLTSVHPADDVRILHRECRSLAAAGYRVTLVARAEPRPDLPGIGFVGVRPAGGRLGRATITTARVLGAALRLRADLYQVHDPELLPAALLLRALGRRVVYDAHEDLPRLILDKAWIHPLVRRPVAAASAALEWVAGRALSGVVTVTPTIAGRFPARRVTLVRNFPPAAEMSGSAAPGSAAPGSAAPGSAARRPVVVYVGSVTPDRGLAELVEAIALVDPALDARLAVAGRIPPVYEARLRARPGWGRTQALGWLGRADVAALLATASVGAVTLHPTPAFVDAYPTKLFEYMAAGLPVIASDVPLWRGIVDGAGCGLLVDPRDPAAIARAIEAILRDPAAATAMGERGRVAALAEYAWEPEGAALVGLCDRLLGIAA